jgi:hypothetical protein
MEAHFMNYSIENIQKELNQANLNELANLTDILDSIDIKIKAANDMINKIKQEALKKQNENLAD